MIERHGKPVKKLRRSYQTAVAAAGLSQLLGEGVVAHTLRHTAITWALQSGADRWEVAGHFNVSMEVLEETYAHHSEQGSARVAILMNKRKWS